MTLRNYSSTAAQTTLSAGVDSSATTLAVSATTGFPSTPFILAVDAGAAGQELVLVTNVAGTNLTVTRGYDSTVPVSHDAGAVVEHSHSALDFREANAHVNADAGVHGVTGDVVGTTDTQVLTNKDLSSGTNTLPTEVVTRQGTQTLTNKTLSSSSNTFPWVIQKGSGDITYTASQTATKAITFGTAFTSAPAVTVSINDERFMFAVKNVTTTGFDLVTNYSLGAAAAGFLLGYKWIAVL